MSLHQHETPADVNVVRRLIDVQRPDLAGLDITPVGVGTDNTVYRLGDDLLIRLPRTPETAESLAKELRWLPRLRPMLEVEIPDPVFEGAPSVEFPLSWAIYGWIDGEPAAPHSVSDWAAYGRDLAAAVDELHSISLDGEERAGDLSGDRGGLLQPHDEWLPECLAQIRALEAEVDVDRLGDIWSQAMELPRPTAPYVWLHGDLKPSNVIVRSGRLKAIIDFGGLSIGYPDAEHAPTWDLPVEARDAYRNTLRIDEQEWLRARTWALMVGAAGVRYYWTSYPEFARECLRRLQAVTGES